MYVLRDVYTRRYLLLNDRIGNVDISLWHIHSLVQSCPPRSMAVLWQYAGCLRHWPSGGGIFFSRSPTLEKLFLTRYAKSVTRDLSGDSPHLKPEKVSRKKKKNKGEGISFTNNSVPLSLQTLSLFFIQTRTRRRLSSKMSEPIRNKKADLATAPYAALCLN